MPKIAPRKSAANPQRFHVVYTTEDERFAILEISERGKGKDGNALYVRALTKTPVAYVGMLGPRQRTERILRNLIAEGPVDEGRVYGPVGLDIGTDGAEQVALAVIAEILAVRSGRRAQSLRERRAAIHAPTD